MNEPDILEVSSLFKRYPAFNLDNASFSLKKGHITGFIGRNGAGKTTTLKSLLNFVHPDSGEIKFFGLDFESHEFEIKKRIGFTSGGIDFYPSKKLKMITSVTKSFYPEWDDAAFSKYIKLFSLDENKTPSQLSAGMRVKYSLSLALSHHAELLLLDEPTSGLDPVSRDDLLDVFLDLANDGITILFSTHITSDLDKCADDIIYIKNGHIISSEPCSSFVGKYATAEYLSAPEEIKDMLIGEKRTKTGFSALLKTSDIDTHPDRIPKSVSVKDADLESIMIHLDKDEIL